MDATKKLLTCSETAAHLGLKEATVRVWVAQRRLSSVKLGRAVRIPLEAIEQIISEGFIPARRDRRQ